MFSLLVKMCFAPVYLVISALNLFLSLIPTILNWSEWVFMAILFAPFTLIFGLF